MFLRATSVWAMVNGMATSKNVYQSVAVNIPVSLLEKVDEEMERVRRVDPTNPVSRGQVIRSLVHEALVTRARVRAGQATAIKKGLVR